MSQSLEAFVEKIKRDGLEAAQKEAQVLLNKTRAEAEALLNQSRAQARAEADALVQDARRQKEKLESETALICRDLVLKLKSDIEALAAVLIKTKAEKAFDDARFVADLIRTMLGEYARQDACGAEIKISLPDKTLGDIESWLKSELAANAGKLRIGFQGGLAGKGFELQFDKGLSVEVSPAVLADAISGAASVRLKSLLEKNAKI